MAVKSGKILFISTMNGDPWGGSEEFWYYIAIWMAQNGHSVNCMVFDWPDGKQEKIDLLKTAGCRVHLLPNPKFAKNFLHKEFLKIKAQKQLIRIAAQSFDLTCISQGGFEDVTHSPFKKLLPFLKKFVLISHNYNDTAKLSMSRKRNLYKWTEAALQNMGDSGRIFSSLKKITGTDIPNQFVIKNPLTIPLRNTPGPWPALNKNGNYVWVVMAQLDVSRKAQDVLVKTLATEKWKNRNWELFLYGNGFDKKLLTDLISALHMEEKILLMGHTKNVSTVLEKAHLLLQITHIDAMPLSVTEAMNVGRPCIVSNVGDMPDWIQDGVNGYISPTVAETDIDATLERAWNEKGSWQQKGEAAFASFRQNYPIPYEPYYVDFMLNL
jgi:glycosyltransferase involved in cell wall biosynthesis